jgi:TIR domain
MAYVPGFRYDLFISYASENNRDGWVEQFQKTLGEELSDLLGRQFDPKNSVFFDLRVLEVAQSFPDTLAAAARDSAILVPVYSPSYLTSRWCNRERNEFFSKLPHGAQPADCLAPILIRPIDEEGLDALSRHVQRVSFLSPDGQTASAVGSLEWDMRLREFAGQLRNALGRLRRNCRPVFLGKAAETDRTQNVRAWCRTEVERRLFRTTPESLPALDDPDLVRSSLQEAGLAIHFLGGGADEKVLETIETSIATCSGPTILYQPFEVELVPDERLWLDGFESRMRPEPGRYQRLAGKNEQELLALFDELITNVRTDVDGTRLDAELALICEEVDLEGVRRLKEAIQMKRPTGVAFPDFLGTRLKAMELVRRWGHYLRRGEALLFYYGSAERNRLDLIWQKAEKDRPTARRDWFLVDPNLERKRRQYPNALWNIDQIIDFIQRGESEQA